MARNLGVLNATRRRWCPTHEWVLSHLISSECPFCGQVTTQKPQGMAWNEHLRLAIPHGVHEVAYGGCVEGSPIHPGKMAAMRKRAHAHNNPMDPHYGCICFKAHSAERVPLALFWHEVAHIWRRSWTEAQCDTWARRQVRAQGQ